MSDKELELRDSSCMSKRCQPHEPLAVLNGSLHHAKATLFKASDKLTSSDSLQLKERGGERRVMA